MLQRRWFHISKETWIHYCVFDMNYSYCCQSYRWALTNVKSEKLSRRMLHFYTLQPQYSNRLWNIVPPGLLVETGLLQGSSCTRICWLSVGIQRLRLALVLPWMHEKIEARGDLRQCHHLWLFVPCSISEKIFLCDNLQLSANEGQCAIIMRLCMVCNNVWVTICVKVTSTGMPRLKASQRNIAFLYL